jgi:hypothetical protein
LVTKLPSDPIAALPYSARPPLAPSLRMPRWVVRAIAGAVVGGPLVAVATSRGATVGARVTRALLLGGGAAYLTTSLVDFAEHFRLERAATGAWLRSTVVPPGETINHAATIAVIAGALALARPIPRRPAPRDLFVLAAPALFLALGWRDELRFHRRRAVHREDLLHTVSHLAAATMWTGLYAHRLVEWRRGTRAGR